MLQLQGRNCKEHYNHKPRSFFEKRHSHRGKKLSEQEKRLILSNYGNQCVVTGICNSKEKPLEFHHIIPPEHGGTNELSNFCPIARFVHRSVHEAIGKLLKSGSPPADKTFIKALHIVQLEYWRALLSFSRAKPAPEPARAEEQPLSQEDKLKTTLLILVSFSLKSREFRKLLKPLKQQAYRDSLKAA